jgi:hypothetical protein
VLRPSVLRQHSGGEVAGVRAVATLGRSGSRHPAAVSAMVLTVQVLLCSAASAAAHKNNAPATEGEPCDMLPNNLTYWQEEAPRDLSGLVCVIVDHADRR